MVWPTQPLVPSMGMKWLRVLLLPPELNAITRLPLSISSGFPDNSPPPIYAPGWREALGDQSVFAHENDTTTWLGLEPRRLDPESSALTWIRDHEIEDV